MPRPASRSVCASARAGMRWPPVPPPANNTLITAPNDDNCGLRIADCGFDGSPFQSAIANPQSEIASYPHSAIRSEEHTSELQSHSDLVCRLLLEKKKKSKY